MKLEIWQRAINPAEWTLVHSVDYGTAYARTGASVSFDYPQNADGIVSGTITCTSDDNYVYDTRFSYYSMTCKAGRTVGRSNWRFGVVFAGWWLNSVPVEDNLRTWLGSNYQDLDVCRNAIELVPGDGNSFEMSNAPEQFENPEVGWYGGTTFRIFVCVHPFDVFYVSGAPGSIPGRAAANLPVIRRTYWRDEPYQILPWLRPVEVIPHDDTTLAPGNLGPAKNFFVGWDVYLSNRTYTTVPTGGSSRDRFLVKVKPGTSITIPVPAISLFGIRFFKVNSVILAARWRSASYLPLHSPSTGLPLCDSRGNLLYDA